LCLVEVSPQMLQHLEVFFRRPSVSLRQFVHYVLYVGTRANREEIEGGHFGYIGVCCNKGNRLPDLRDFDVVAIMGLNTVCAETGRAGSRAGARGLAPAPPPAWCTRQLVRAPLRLIRYLQS